MCGSEVCIIELERKYNHVTSVTFLYQLPSISWSILCFMSKGKYRCLWMSLFCSLLFGEDHHTYSKQTMAVLSEMTMLWWVSWGPGSPNFRIPAHGTLIPQDPGQCLEAEVSGPSWPGQGPLLRIPRSPSPSQWPVTSKDGEQVTRTGNGHRDHVRKLGCAGGRYILSEHRNKGRDKTPLSFGLCVSLFWPWIHHCSYAFGLWWPWNQATLTCTCFPTASCGAGIWAPGHLPPQAWAPVAWLQPLLRTPTVGGRTRWDLQLIHTKAL